eukprot:1341583-Amphidinium_carterae.1
MMKAKAASGQTRKPLRSSYPDDTFVDSQLERNRSLFSALFSCTRALATGSICPTAVLSAKVPDTPVRSEETCYERSFPTVGPMLRT